MFGLDTAHALMLILLLFATVAFEFINGFHDTANAVATVIYTNAMKPKVAVLWAGFWNFLGVYVGGIAVAMGIMHLIPTEMLADQNIYYAMALIGAILITAIGWNFLTWYLGIPASSSHTLIGSMFGVGLAYMLLHPESGVDLNWQKIIDIALALFITPILGFVLALLLMFILFKVVKKKKIFKEPKEKKAPPFWIRSILILTSTTVSFSHGSNDGQKGVGIMMLVLIAMAPTFFALDNSKDPRDLMVSMGRIAQVVSRVDASQLSAGDRAALSAATMQMATISSEVKAANHFNELSRGKAAEIRNDLQVTIKSLKKLKSDNHAAFKQHNSRVDLHRFDREISNLTGYIDYAPTWVILLISLALGLGTMVGWKRIVVTISEKIGKTQMTYAQGVTSGVIASSTIGLSSVLGLPVSTTHILSSGVAGSMVASGGIRNLQTKTLTSIAIAWVVTLPVTILVAGLLYWLFVSLI